MLCTKIFMQISKMADQSYYLGFVKMEEGGRNGGDRNINRGIGLMLIEEVEGKREGERELDGVV